MNDTTVDSLIPYDEIVQTALRSVVQRVLERIDAEGGLPGAHHFYIAFRTRFPGVEMPKHLLERYPEEMTIVIQHRYWDLTITDERFTIGLSFNQVPAKLSIPFAAVTGFVRSGGQLRPAVPADRRRRARARTGTRADAAGGGRLERRHAGSLPEEVMSEFFTVR